MRVPRGIRNNNPFNIVWSTSNRWLGQSNYRDGSFCKFEAMKYGLRAGIILLRNYVEKHHLSSVEGIIQRFSPKSENNTYLYISFVRSILELYNLPTDDIRYDTPQFWFMLKAILRYESKYDISIEDLMNVAREFNIKSSIVKQFDLFGDDANAWPLIEFT